MAGWQAEWEAGARLVGYRRQAPLTLLILAAFAQHPCPDPAQCPSEAAMGLALLCRLSTDCDDQARLETAEDQTEALLTILAQDREQVLPDVVERVVDRGPMVVPHLMGLLDPDEFSWGMLRAVQALERLARRHPGSCDAAIPTLIAMIHEEQSDYLKEACSSALEAIGPAVVELAAAHLRDGDLSRRIYLTGVLGEIPTEGAAQAVLGLLKDSEFVDEQQVAVLADIGSPSAIEPLCAIWETEALADHLLAEPLLVLCEVNGVDKPDLPEWRRIAQAEEARIAKIAQVPFGGRIEPPPRRKRRRPESPGKGRGRARQRGRSAREPRTVSKREKKLGRNEPCWCGSGKKYKRCHLDSDRAAERTRQG